MSRGQSSGLRQLCQALVNGIAQLTKGAGVTVNAVLPGPTASDGVTEFVGSLTAKAKQPAAEFEQEFFRHVRPTFLLQRFATVEEIARTVVFTCSPLTSAQRIGRTGRWGSFGLRLD